MSKTKAGGSVKNVHDSPGQRLGVKRFGGEKVATGAIIVRQRGSSKVSGPGTAYGKDHTIYAVQDGTVSFKQKNVIRFTGRKARRTEVSVK